MYNEQLEGLISAALADGELTEKEKQILFKKAQSMGIDLDEFEMVLDARLVELKKAEKAKAESSAPKSNKLGDVKKCPACGAIVQSFQGACPECGYTFEQVDVNSSAKELSNLLRKVRNEKEMSTIIDTFPIPIEKAALIAFITWLRPQSLDVTNPLQSSYHKKYEECIHKAMISFNNDKEFVNLIATFNEDTKVLKKKKILATTTKLLKLKRFWIGLVVFIIVIYNIIPSPMNKSADKTNAAIIDAVDKGNLEQAEQFYLNFKHSEFRDNPDKGRECLFNAYIKAGNLEKAATYMVSSKDKDLLFEAYIEKGEYEKAYQLYPWRIDDIISYLCSKGEKQEAKSILKRHRTDAEKRKHNEETLYETCTKIIGSY